MAAVKQFCFVIRHAPDDDFRAGELLDMALTTAAFDQIATVVFMDEGVLHLLPGRNSRSNVVQMLAAFDLYDLAPPWVETESLSARGATAADLPVPVRFIDKDELSRLLARQQVLVAG
ncbi:hypothetical protein F6R98_12290 [Candidatus Methylospira mobilis]|uniref:Uncharacterized protein n=1 Tax=Candidatus Methylospira mobilis TaxID=1808979 RepID=A0A5Q0BHJ6_9GAMM|nr:DsrE family protein [Candidatus Methylospira mobilis]QFY43300.1 hypothetical protein F6R98_12290 [Candidatus Methylospira mobilis]